MLSSDKLESEAALRRWQPRGTRPNVRGCLGLLLILRGGWIQWGIKTKTQNHWMMGKSSDKVKWETECVSVSEAGDRERVFDGWRWLCSVRVGVTGQTSQTETHRISFLNSTASYLFLPLHRSSLSYLSLSAVCEKLEVYLGLRPGPAVHGELTDKSPGLGR